MFSRHYREQKSSIRFFALSNERMGLPTHLHEFINVQSTLTYVPDRTHLTTLITSIYKACK